MFPDHKEPHILFWKQYRVQATKKFKMVANYVNSGNRFDPMNDSSQLGSSIDVKISSLTQKGTSLAGTA